MHEDIWFGVKIEFFGTKRTKERCTYEEGKREESKRSEESERSEG